MSTPVTTTVKTTIKTKDIEDDTKDSKKKKREPISRQTIIKFIIIGLTLFYGQLLANVFYNNFVSGIPELVVDSTSVLAILKVVVGVFILAIAIFSLITVYMKKHMLIFISACILIAVSVVALVISIVDLVMRRERGQTVGKDFAESIGKCVLESLFRVIAISVEFFMIHLLKQEYIPVSTTVA